MAKRSKGSGDGRRTPGSGYTRKEPNGTWTALYPKATGHGYHVKRGFAAEAAAAQWLADLAERAAARYDVAGGEQTLDRLIDRWLDRQEERVRAGKLKQRTWNDYDFKLGYARDLLGDRRISDLMPDHIDDAMTTIGKALAETTTRQIRALLHRILEDARGRRYIASNPVIVERGAAAERQAPERWNARTARAFLRSAEGSFYEPAWWLLLTLGLRAGEVCGLRRADIDLESRTLTIAQTVADLRGVPTLSTPKTKAGRRVVPLAAALVPMLAAHLDWLDRRAAQSRQKRARYDAARVKGRQPIHEPGIWHEHGLVFPGRGGRPMNPTSLYHQLCDLCDAARIPRMKVHDLRHTAAKFYTDLHVEERYIKALLGHAPNITGHYAPPDADAMRPYVEQVYGMLAGGAERGRKTG